MKTPDPNKKNEDELEREEFQPERQDPAEANKTDDFSEDEQKRIVQIVLEDKVVGENAYADWKKQKEKDLQQIAAAKPSLIDGTTKEAWQSDRNLGLLPGVLDIYQATLTATCYNPDSIHFKDTAKNDVNNRDNLEKFTKWMVNPAEVNLEPEVDDFIANRVGLGFSIFKIDWEVKYEWVDRRIPKYAKAEPGKRKRITGYEIEEEYRRFERGRIRNIDNVDDILLPSYGKHIQELPFIIEILHLHLSDIADMETRGIISSRFSNKDKKTKAGDPTMPKLEIAPSQAATKESLAARKALDAGIAHDVDPDGRDFPIDVLEWYGYFTKNGKREKYRFQVELTTETFISGKPVRKIRRDGKFPYAGGPFRRTPGQIRGGSLTSLIAPASDALNNNYNQTSDFQYVENMPIGFYNPDEGSSLAQYNLVPGKLYPTEGDPSKAVYFPNNSRSLAWSYQDKQFLLETIERLTGAASYFLTSGSAQTTATRDNIVQEKSDTKFGIWVKRIQNDIVEAINMCVALYQDWAPPDLATRVLGEDGKQIIRNLSIDTLRGNYDAYMTADQTSGSKIYRAQMMLWAFKELQTGSIWLNPQVNPRGNWLLTKETMARQGFENPEHFLPPQPRQKMEEDEEAEQEFERFKQGEAFDPPEGDSPAVVAHYMTHMKQRENRYHELDKEYRANFDDHEFKTFVNYKKFMQKMQQEQQAAEIAARATQLMESLGKPRSPMAPGAMPMQPGQQMEQQPMPGQAPAGMPQMPMGAE